ncbi:hypothetical protein ACU4GR_26805 [Methylobacterium oryzae CBMB20]
MPDEVRPQLMALRPAALGKRRHARVEIARTQRLALEERPAHPRASLHARRDGRGCRGLRRSPGPARGSGGGEVGGVARRRPLAIGSPGAALARGRADRGGLPHGHGRPAGRRGCPLRRRSCGGAAPFVPGTWEQACAILDLTLAIGRQAPEIALAGARKRLDAARAMAAV